MSDYWASCGCRRDAHPLFQCAEFERRHAASFGADDGSAAHAKARRRLREVQENARASVFRPVGDWVYAINPPGCVSQLRDPARAVDDGSAAHEPENSLIAAYNDLVTELRRMQGENARLRALLNCVDDATAPAAPSPDVKGDIERTIDHLLNGRTTEDQRRGLSTATERAGRVTSGSDAAVGRALKW